MTAVAPLTTTMHDSSLTANLHRASLPPLRPAHVELKTTPTSIFKRSFEALAHAASLDGIGNDDGLEDSCSDDADLYSNNRCNIITVGLHTTATTVHNSNDEFHGGHLPRFRNFDTNNHLTNPSVICNNIIKSGYKVDHSNVNNGNYNKKNSNNDNSRRIYGDDNDDNDVESGDDEDFSDHDSHYSADLEEVYFPIMNYSGRPESPNVSKQLIDFADLISADIQKFFGRKSGDEDSCDIYEDKWISNKSGRELYYADLLRIAHGENTDSRRSSSKQSATIAKATTSSAVSERQSSVVVDNKDKFSGRLNKSLGLGPLNELFEFGLRNFIDPKSKSSTKKLKRLRLDLKKHDDIIPMSQRKMPRSFWKQPCSGSMAAKSKYSTRSAYMLNSSKTPDFSDLLESWTTGVDRNDFSGDLSCSDVSTTSSD
ncbi:Hypothetical predicted protein [Argonauta hians]